MPTKTHVIRAKENRARLRRARFEGPGSTLTRLAVDRRAVEVDDAANRLVEGVGLVAEQFAGAGDVGEGVLHIAHARRLETDLHLAADDLADALHQREQ